MKKGIICSRFLLYVVMLIFLVGAFGCSSGGDEAAPGGQTISGVAAAGAPIIGAVTVKDSLGVERTTSIAADGGYSVDVSGMRPPFMLRADGYVGGREYHLYSAGLEADINRTINITPFTDLIIANIARQVAEKYYDSGNFADLTPATLAAAETNLQEKLQDILTALGVAPAIDLLRTSFNTDHTGLDAVMDIVKVEVDPETVLATLTNIVNGQTITVDIENDGAATGELTGDGVTKDVVTALQAIVSSFNTFSSLFATSLPAEDNPTLRGLFDEPEFLADGQDLDEFLSEITTDTGIIGIKFANIVLLALDEEGGTAEVAFTLLRNGQAVETEKWRMIKKGSTWFMQGNGRIAKTEIHVQAQYFPSNSEGNKLHTGLALNVRANYPAGENVKSAVVTGPGLPEEGVVLNRQIENEWFEIGNSGNNLDDMDDTTIETIPEKNAEYTIKLYDSANGGGTLLDTYKENILSRPVKNSDLSAASFPAITAPTIENLRAFNSGNLTVTWTLPAGLRSDMLELVLADAGWTHTERVESDLNSTETTKTLVVTPQTWTVANRNIYLHAKDIYDRSFMIEIR